MSIPRVAFRSRHRRRRFCPSTAAPGSEIQAWKAVLESCSCGRHTRPSSCGHPSSRQPAADHSRVVTARSIRMPMPDMPANSERTPACSNAVLKFASVSARGTERPCSYLAIAPCDTPDFSESSSCFQFNNQARAARTCAAVIRGSLSISEHGRGQLGHSVLNFMND